MNTTNNVLLYRAEAEMSLVSAVESCGESIDALADDGEVTIYGVDDNPIVSFWPIGRGGYDARWHRREARPNMDGDLTCPDGCAESRGYYSCYRR